MLSDGLKKTVAKNLISGIVVLAAASFQKLVLLCRTNIENMCLFKGILRFFLRFRV